MNRPVPQFIAVFLVLMLLAIYDAQQALDRGAAMMSLVLMFAALLFWKRLSKKT